MKLNEYQAKAMTFRLPTANAQYAVLNLAAESGEVLGLIAKALRDGPKPDFHEQAKKELGDVLWQLAAVAADLNFSLEEVAKFNIDKLASRSDRGTLQGSGDNR